MNKKYLVTKLFVAALALAVFAGSSQASTREAGLAAIRLNGDFHGGVRQKDSGLRSLRIPMRAIQNEPPPSPAPSNSQKSEWKIGQPSFILAGTAAGLGLGSVLASNLMGYAKMGAPQAVLLGSGITALGMAAGVHEKVIGFTAGGFVGLIGAYNLLTPFTVQKGSALACFFAGTLLGVTMQILMEKSYEQRNRPE